jgi:hypothetical protein
MQKFNFKIGKTAIESPGNVNNLSSERKLERAQSFKWFVWNSKVKSILLLLNSFGIHSRVHVKQMKM